MAELETARERLLKQYEESGADFYVDTRPQESVVYFEGKVLDKIAAVGNRPAIALVEFGPQDREAFGYGRKDIVPGLGVTATDADTTLDQGNRTPGGLDFAIDGFTSHFLQARAVWKEDKLDPLTPPAWRRYLTQVGQDVMADPSSIVSPTAVDSPLNMAPILYRTLAQSIATALRFDKSGEIDMGTLDLYPSGPDSYFHATSTPAYGERYAVKEGYIWRGEGPDSRMSLWLRLRRSTVIPMYAISLPGSVGDIAPSPRPLEDLPERILVGVKVRAFGVGFRFASINA